MYQTPKNHMQDFFTFKGFALPLGQDSSGGKGDRFLNELKKDESVENITIEVKKTVAQYRDVDNEGEVNSQTQLAKEIYNPQPQDSKYTPSQQAQKRKSAVKMQYQNKSSLVGQLLSAGSYKDRKFGQYGPRKDNSTNKKFKSSHQKSQDVSTTPNTGNAIYAKNKSSEKTQDDISIKRFELEKRDASGNRLDAKGGASRASINSSHNLSTISVNMNPNRKAQQIQKKREGMRTQQHPVQPTATIEVEKEPATPTTMEPMIISRSQTK